MGVVRPPARGGSWAERPPAISPTAEVVIEVAEPLRFRLAGASMIGGPRGGSSLTLRRREAF